MNDLPRTRVSRLMGELKRRRVFRVAAVYAAAAFIVVQVADITFPALQLPGWTITLVVALAILCFPVAVALAWIFDVEPEGIQRTAQRGALSGAAPSDPTAGAASEVVPEAASLPPGAERAGRQVSPAPASVAVLPFVNLSSDPEQEYFSDGLTEELLSVLAQVPGLRVPARTSSFAFKGRNVNIEEIGRVLKVRTVLEGSVRRWRDDLVITAQLIEVETGYHLWSDTYDRRLEDVFAIQREIARSIVQTLKGRLLPADAAAAVREASADPEAYQLFLKARHFQSQFTVEGSRRALTLFQEAVAKDPHFARAWAALGNTGGVLAYMGAAPVDEALREAWAAAERALELDAGLAEAYSARGLLAILKRDFGAAESDSRRAVDLDPSFPRAHNAYGNLLHNLCRSEEAIAAFRRASELDPLWVGPINNLALVHRANGRDAEALTLCQQALELAPASQVVMRNLARALSGLGRHDEAIARAREVHAHDPSASSKAVLAVRLFLAGRRAEAEPLLAELEAERAEGRAPTWAELSGLYVVSGQTDHAFEALERALDAEDLETIHLAVSPDFDPVRDDSRWEPLLVRAGFPEDAIRRGRELYERRRAAAGTILFAPSPLQHRG